MAGQIGMLDYLKLALRIRSGSYDAELLGMINACRIDLQNGGVVKTDETDDLVRQAVKLYCKAYFGFEENAGRYAQAYEALKQSMALSGEYGNVDGTGNQPAGV